MTRLSDLITRLRFVTIWSRDLGASRNFYIDKLGLRLLDEKPGEFFQFEIAGVPVCVDYHSERSGKESNQFGLEVTDFAALKQELEKIGAHFNEGQRGNERWTTTRDPDGHEIIFVERS